MQFVHKTFEVHEAHSAGQSSHTLVSLYIFLGHSIMHWKLYKIPVKQLRHVLVVLAHVLQGAVHEMQVLFKNSSYNPYPQSVTHLLVELKKK